jgi:hypothetical protein
VPRHVREPRLLQAAGERLERALGERAAPRPRRPAEPVVHRERVVGTEDEQVLPARVPGVVLVAGDVHDVAVV